MSESQETREAPETPEPETQETPVEAVEAVQAADNAEAVQAPDNAEVPAPNTAAWPMMDPAAPWSEQAPPKVKRKLPWRWVGAVVTMLAVGTGCAFAVMAPQRTELPGLKTAADGRYDFAPLVLPTLAPGQSGPGDTANVGAQHISDIRKLLLSPPVGAVPDHSLPGTSGWVSRASVLSVLHNPSAAETFQTDGLRHTAGIAWKTPDGADTKIWLLQFIDSDDASDAYSTIDSFDGASPDASNTIAAGRSASVAYNRVVKGTTATWYGQVQVYDADFLIEYTAPVSVGIAPFEQEVDLQVEMLQ